MKHPHENFLRTPLLSNAGSFVLKIEWSIARHAKGLKILYTYFFSFVRNASELHDASDCANLNFVHRWQQTKPAPLFSITQKKQPAFH